MKTETQKLLFTAQEDLQRGVERAAENELYDLASDLEHRLEGFNSALEILTNSGEL